MTVKDLGHAYRGTVALGAALALWGPTAVTVSAQSCMPPTNDNCDGAISFTFADLPLHIAGRLGCENDMVDRPYFDVFFRYDCTVAGEYVVDMCGTTGDSYMRIYVDGCGWAPSSSSVEDDDACPGSPNTLDPLITLTMQAGTSYWFELGSWRVDEAFPPNANDPFAFNVVFVPPCTADCATPADGNVDVGDLLETLAQWGMAGSCDIDTSGTVDVSDLLDVLAAWGPC